MKIQLIAEGSTTEDRRSENWGISFLIGETTLFDTFGKPGKFTDNLERFNVDVSKIRNVVISHDDWDHISGLPRLLELNNRVEVCLCQHTDNQALKNIKNTGVTVIEPREFLQIAENIYTTGEYKCLSDNRIIYEQMLFIQSCKGITLLSGCAHPGIIKIIECLIQHLGVCPYCIMGGFHLRNTPVEEVKEAVKRLKEFGVQMVCPLHCTGHAAVNTMKHEFTTGFIEMKEGSIVEV